MSIGQRVDRTKSSFSFSEEVSFSEEAANVEDDDDEDELVVAVTGLMPYANFLYDLQSCNHFC